MLCNFIRHIYDDLKRAEAYYRMYRSWVTAGFVQPGSLVYNKQVGHLVSIERQQTYVPVVSRSRGGHDRLCR